MRHRLALALLPLLAAGCAQGSADLNYSHAGAVPAFGAPVIADVTVADLRALPPGRVGAVNGYDGRTLKPVETAGPAADAVALAFRQALAARGALAQGGAPARYDLDVALLQLNAEQDAERQGEADLRVRLIDRATGAERYSARVYVESRGDQWLAVDNGVFGSTAALSRLADAVLSRAIDRAIDQPGFRTALR
jgi:hypothetical protein